MESFIKICYNIAQKEKKMNNFDNYKYLLGETIINYQLIENDLKMIYAGMLSGDFNDNFDYADKTFHGLGQIINALQKLDNSDNKPYFSKEDYKILKNLARDRNYYCHQCAIDFGYIQNFINSTEYKKNYSKLQSVNTEIKRMQKLTEDFRLEILKKYNRIK